MLVTVSDIAGENTWFTVLLILSTDWLNKWPTKRTASETNKTTKKKKNVTT